MSSRSLGGITKCEACTVGVACFTLMKTSYKNALIIQHFLAVAKHMNEMLGSDNASL